MKCNFRCIRHEFSTLITGRGSTHTDDMFEKYEQNTSTAVANKRKRLMVDTEIDLIANVEDHKGIIEFTDVADRQYKENSIVKKYNLHSTILVEGQEVSNASKRNKGEDNETTSMTCSELQGSRKSEYVALKLNSLCALPPGERDQEEGCEEEVSAFSQKRVIEHLVDVEAENNNYRWKVGSKMYQEMQKIFPSEKRCWHVLQSDRDRLIDNDHSSGPGNSTNRALQDGVNADRVFNRRNIQHYDPSSLLSGNILLHK